MPFTALYCRCVYVYVYEFCVYAKIKEKCVEGEGANDTTDTYGHIHRSDEKANTKTTIKRAIIEILAYTYIHIVYILFN